MISTTPPPTIKPFLRLQIPRTVVFYRMRLFIISMLISLSSTAMATPPETLETLRWKHRILVIPEVEEQILAKLKQNKSDLDARDLKIVIVTADGFTVVELEITNRFNISPSSKEILLIGKDGRTTLRWPSDEFTFDQLFQRIDAMPMRQREMSER